MSDEVRKILNDIFERLQCAYGPQHWWPADSAMEVIVGAILTQNTAWSNVERAIVRLREADSLSWSALRDVSQEELAELIKPSGTFRVKAARLKAFVNALWGRHKGSLDTMLAGELQQVRGRLLAIHGIGPETADAILLYAGHRPTFVVDAYTKRVLRRHHIIWSDAEYANVQRLFHEAIAPEPRIYNEYHALLVAVGKKHCRSRARCDGCPLDGLPHAPEL